MKRNKPPLYLILFLVIIFALQSCNNNIKSQEPTAAGFLIIEKEIKSKFGAHAYYTDLKIIHSQSIGNIISVIVARYPESLKMEEWNLTENCWSQISEISIEVPRGALASDFMFVLNDEINLTKLGALIEQSMQKIQIEKGIQNPLLSNAYIDYPKNGDANKATYQINLKTQNSGEIFRFSYQLNGEPIKIVY